MIQFRSLTDLSLLSRKIQIPEVDAIAGIPRSGLMAATMVALRYNLPLLGMDGKLIASGKRLGQAKSPSRVLLLDDSYLSGRTMAQAAKLLEPHGFKLYRGAMYVQPGVNLDAVGEYLQRPRVFEWNVLHHSILKKSCIDIDGLLCVDPTKRQNDDGPRYRDFIRNASPKYRPTKPLGTLVTNRLEKYRALTEAWLRQQGIQYESLEMLNLPSKSARLRSDYMAHKASIYSRTKAALFLESSDKQAAEIARRTNKPVISVQSWRMYD